MLTIEQVRDAHKGLTSVDGLRAWIVKTDWGLGVRFYHADIAYPGMVEYVKDGRIELIEKI